MAVDILLSFTLVILRVFDEPIVPVTLPLNVAFGIDIVNVLVFVSPICVVLVAEAYVLQYSVPVADVPVIFGRKVLGVAVNDTLVADEWSQIVPVKPWKLYVIV